LDPNANFQALAELGDLLGGGFLRLSRHFGGELCHRAGVRPSMRRDRAALSKSGRLEAPAQVMEPQPVEAKLSRFHDEMLVMLDRDRGLVRSLLCGHRFYFNDD
jgi:hypothetical protein